jgi:hypothetical protein
MFTKLPIRIAPNKQIMYLLYKMFLDGLRICLKNVMLSWMNEGNGFYVVHIRTNSICFYKPESKLRSQFVIISLIAHSLDVDATFTSPNSFLS